MGLQKDYEDAQIVSDVSYEEDEIEVFDQFEDATSKKRTRRLIEERLERKRLKAELEDELDGEFDWSELER